MFHFRLHGLSNVNTQMLFRLSICFWVTELILGGVIGMYRVRRASDIGSYKVASSSFRFAMILRHCLWCRFSSCASVERSGPTHWDDLTRGYWHVRQGCLPEAIKTL
jgi:hypothetical protein